MAETNKNSTKKHLSSQRRTKNVQKNVQKTTGGKNGSSVIVVDENQLSLLPEETEVKTKRSRAKREIKVEELKARNIIRTELKDLTMDEIRGAVKRLETPCKPITIALDERNIVALEKVVKANGINKLIMCDLALKRFLDDCEKKKIGFPYQALSEVDITSKKTSIIVSVEMKERLDKLCVELKQQIQVTINLAIQCLCDELRNTIE
ncbi:hypothetical protein [Turicibacter sanguinis]|uniref:hypothetical protein n=1 Tax=Turicibacter sanguinis TaxID=154288 RepID=UPI00189E747B|nr:hypothetical protein [Turicibacter sanguinis]